MTWSSFQTADGSTGGWVRGAGDGVALLLHGGPGLADYMEGVADEVAAALPGYRIARYQQRGMAPSTESGPFTVEQLVDDLFAVADHFGASEVVLVGHSWGGHLAMHAGVARPERVAAMVLLDGLGAVGDGGLGTMESVIGQRIGEEAAARAAALEASDLSSVEKGTAIIEVIWPGYFADPAAAPPPPQLAFDVDVNEAVLGDAVRLLEEGVLERALPTMDVPSVHVISRASPIDPAANRATAALCANAQVVELDCGHFPWMEQPDAVADAVRALAASARL